MKIVAVEPIGISPEKAQEIKLELAAMGHEFVFFPDRREDAESLRDRMRDAEVVVISNIPLKEEVLSACPKLKHIALAFTGKDHIDGAYCAAHGITIRNAAGYATRAVGELAVGLMLDVFRRITALDAEIRHGGVRGAFLGRELYGKTAGIVGTGAIGTYTAKLLQAFGCKVVAWNRSEHDEVKAMGIPYLPLDELLRQSDIISLHVPLTPETFHLISAEKLALCKPTAILVNTARGNVVDMDALAVALREGCLAGAGLDVYEKEPPLPENHPLLHAPNVVMAPHVGYATREAFDSRIDIVFSYLKDYLKEAVNA